MAILKVAAGSARSFGLTHRQHQALLFLRGSREKDRAGWLPLHKLRRYLVADKATAGQLVARLERLGLVETKRKSQEAPVLVRLTPQGSQLLEEIAQENQRSLRKLAREFDPRHVSTVLDHVLRYIGVEE